MDKKLDIFYFSSTHWDREWYQDFQGFRYRLVKMVDALCGLFDNDPDYKTFHFDGQTIVLEDYCEISPEKKDKLKKLIADGKILIGPWYVMPDEFLLSGESLIRNLMRGHELAREWGVEPWKYGYVCDIFGHIAQMPQIFNGFDIKYSLVGRGMTETDPMYFRWRSPDGSECLTFNLEPDVGYGSFNQRVYAGLDDISTDNPEIVKRLKEYVDKELERSNLPAVILMDGFDHSSVCTGTSGYIKKLAELYPDARIHHVNLCEQGRLLEAHRNALPVISGELNRTAQYLHGYLHLITNTLSSYYPIKKENDECQNLLEKNIEPMLVLAKLGNRPLNRSFLRLAYKYLLQNHPHDSICGCSIDKVHKDMEYRFSQTKGLCCALREDYLYQDCTDSGENSDYILTLYNMLPFALDRTISVDLGFKPGFAAVYFEPFGYEDINSFRIYDCDGNEIPYLVTDIKRNCKKRIFDQICEERDIHSITLRVKIPACGKSEYRIVPSETSSRYMKKLESGADYAENDYIRMDILPNGAISITDKKTGRCYSNLCNLVDDGEIGDGWYHANPVNDIAVYSNGGSCRIEKTESGPSRCVFKITRSMEVPARLERTPKGMRRSDETVTLNIIMYAALSEEGRRVDLRMEYDNTARDHRMRLMLPTGITTDTYFAGQAFYCCERKTGAEISTQDWIETDQCEKATNGIIGKRGADGCGIAFICAKGIHECSAYNDSEGTICATLSRSFSTTVMTNGETRCQLNKKLSYEFSLMPIDKDVTYSDLLKYQDILAHDIMSNFTAVSADITTGQPESCISVSGRNIAVSIIKLPEDSDENAVIIRVFNASAEKSSGAVVTAFNITAANMLNLNEEVIAAVPFEKNRIGFELDAWKIATFKLSL